jgi:hypothetical protein
MKKINSLSGGKSSSFMAVNYPADFELFSLVRTNDKKCLFPDKKIRQIVSDKINNEFIGTLEMDDIIYTMLDLEQFIGRQIIWLSPITFDELVFHNGKVIMPNIKQRSCTSNLKVKPIMEFWQNNINVPAEMNIGFRANEMKRAKNMIERCDENGFEWSKFIVGKHKNGNNKWKQMNWRKPKFPLIENAIFRDEIHEFWKNKPVRFAKLNNCVGCFYRNEILLKHMSNEHPNKFDWFNNVEKESLKYKKMTWRNGITYEKIKNHKMQTQLFDNDFNSCDSGSCGL